MATVQRSPIPCHSLTQVPACAEERFHLLDDRFDFADIDLLTGHVDPLVIALLRKHQVVRTTWVAWPRGEG